MSSKMYEQGNCDPDFANKRGQLLWRKVWVPKGDPSALLFIAHGFGEHCLFYDAIAEQMNGEQILVFSHDHVGHGRSEGTRCLVQTFEEYTEDLHHHCDQMKAEYPNLPMFLLGHSMGGTMVLKAAMERPRDYAGIVAIAPAIVPSPETAIAWKIFIGRIIAKIYPNCPISRLNSSYICHDQSVVEVYVNDPLCYKGGMKAGWGVAMLDALEFIQSNCCTVDWPFLIVHGGEDRICSIDGARIFYESATSSDKKLSEYEGAYHQVHREPDGIGERAIQEMITWIKERI